MSDWTLSAGGLLFEVLEGSLTLALEGPGIATLEIGEEAPPPAGPADLLFAQGDDEPQAFVGTITFVREYEGRTAVVWLGGAGGLGGGTIATHYATILREVERADVVRDIVAAAGEQLADPELGELAGLTLERWTRAAAETWAQALSRALAGTGLAWRVLDTGRVWVGAETWSAAELGGVELDEARADQVLHVGFDRATLRPGTQLADGRRVARVTFSSDGFVDVALERDDTSLAALAAVLAPRVPTDPYARRWRAEVVKQHDDQTIDVRPLDPGAPFGDLPRIPFDVGVQGARCVLPQDAWVWVAFDGAGPDGARASGRPTSVAADRGVARFGDHCKAGNITAVGSPAGIVVTYTAPRGAQSTGTFTGVDSVTSAPITFAGTFSADLEAEIDSASEEVFLQ